MRQAEGEFRVEGGGLRGYMHLAIQAQEEFALDVARQAVEELAEFAVVVAVLMVEAGPRNDLRGREGGREGGRRSTASDLMLIGFYFL